MCCRCKGCKAGPCGCSENTQVCACNKVVRRVSLLEGVATQVVHNFNDNYIIADVYDATTGMDVGVTKDRYLTDPNVILLTANKDVTVDVIMIG